jgi:hypothetical protein
MDHEMKWMNVFRRAATTRPSVGPSALFCCCTGKKKKMTASQQNDRIVPHPDAAVLLSTRGMLKIPVCVFFLVLPGASTQHAPYPYEESAGPLLF